MDFHLYVLRFLAALGMTGRALGMTRRALGMTRRAPGRHCEGAERPRQSPLRMAFVFVWWLLCVSLTLCSLPGFAADGNVTEPIALTPGTAKSGSLSRGKILVAQSEALVQPDAERSKTTTASIKGTVFNFTTEKPVDNAHIVATLSAAEHKRVQATTAPDGTFSLTGLEPGEWDLTISAQDMLAESRKLNLTAGETKVLKITLEEVEAVDVLRITGKRTLIHPEKIGSTTNLDHTFIEQYRSGNQVQELITSTPGAMPDSYGNIIVRGEHNAINYEVDGVVLPEAAGVLQQSQFASPRSLQSMQVDIGGYQAQDGGGPLGAVVRMKSLPIKPKPMFNIGGQIGGPVAGSINFYTSGALSEDPKSFRHKIRFEASGATIGTVLGLTPPVKHFRRNARAELNYLGKIEFLASEKDTFKLSALLNESWSQIPTSGTSQAFGVRMNQHDRQDLVILSYRRKGERLFDDLNLHIINGFYSERLQSRNAFDPFPILNGEEPIANAVAPLAKRFNYVFGAQGDISRTVFNTHRLKAGFLTEVRPVRTRFAALYYNANPLRTDIPYAAPISPFTQLPGGPLFVGNLGNYKGFRYLQSAYFQDSWRPVTGILKRLTLDAGVRVDVYHGVFGDTMKVAETIATIPDVPTFLTEPFQKQKVTDAQASGRFGAAFVLTKNTVIRGSFSNIFQPPPVDVFVQPPIVDEIFNGTFNGTVRPIRATRGELVDTSVEHQIGPRFVVRQNLFYKKLKNFGDSGVIINTPVYNRLTLSNQEAYGAETRMDLRPDREGYGFNGFVSNTVQVARLRGCKCVTGGIYETEEEPNTDNYPDHDRRYSLVAGVGYKGRNNVWVLGDVQVYTGVPDRRNPLFFGVHPARTPVRTNLSLSLGYQTPKRIRDGRPLMPVSFDVRIDNMLNQRLPINLGSPFQGTRYSLPLRVLVGANWQV